MVTTLQEIPRVKAGTTAGAKKVATDELSQERLMLANRAADLLGYKALIANVTGTQVPTKTTGKLTETLLKLEIETLDTASVIDYQLSEAARATRESIFENFKEYATGWFNPAQWTRASFDSYHQPIPEFVLEKAIRIKEALPEVRFYVQHLNQPKADPFLVAYLDQEIYYIEAWDEPRFEGRFSASDIPF